MINRHNVLMVGTCLASLVAASNAWAQASDVDTPGIKTAEQVIAEAAAREKDSKEIVVTGTLLRGVAPGGTESITVTQEQIQAVGAVTPSQILASLPQAGYFNLLPAVYGNTGVGISINRPNLRGLQGADGATSTTLLLLDGHRLPGMGIQQNGPDADSVPANAIERVEVVTDGGSALYGTDAVAGVVNYITRKRYDGVEVGGHFGFADDFTQYDVNLLAGKDWGWGSAFIAYDYVWHDEYYGYDRDYNQNIDWTNTVRLGTLIPNSSSCAPGTVVRGSGSTAVNYALPSMATNVNGGLGNRCDNSDYATLYPRENKHSVFARFTLDDGGPLTASISAFYNHRENISDSGPLAPATGQGVRVNRLLANGSPNPSYIPFPNLATQPANELILFNLGPALGYSTKSYSTLESFGITPELHYELGDNWRVSLLGNYGRGDSVFRGQGGVSFNTAALTTAANAGLFDFVNLTNPNNAATLATVSDWYDYGRGINELYNARLVVDGSLFQLPGGDVKVAVGGEYIKEKYQLRRLQGVSTAGIDALPWNRQSRDVWAAFGEINVPIIGPENAGLFHSLTLSAAGRYDHYSDFGDTFNPKIGLTFEPIEGLTLRGNWTKSFQAPALFTLSQAGALMNSALPVSAAPAIFAKPGLPFITGQNDVVVTGTQLPLQPQKGESYSFGFDVAPPPISGLSLGASYYKIRFYDIISQPGFGQSTFWSQYPDLYATYDDPARFNQFKQELLAENLSSATRTAVTNATPANTYALVKALTSNYGTQWVKGFDFYANLRVDAGFGVVFANFNGNLPISILSQNSPTAPIVKLATQDQNKPRLRSTMSIGTDIGAFRGQATWNHTDGYPIIPTPDGQTYVSAYNAINLFFRYRVPGESMMLKNLEFTLNVDNLFDVDPPVLHQNNGFANQQGQTQGRLFKLGVSKKF